MEAGAKPHLFLPNLEGLQFIQRHINAVALRCILPHISKNVGELIGCAECKRRAVDLLKRALKKPRR